MQCPECKSKRIQKNGKWGKPVYDLSFPETHNIGLRTFKFIPGNLGVLNITALLATCSVSKPKTLPKKSMRRESVPDLAIDIAVLGEGENFLGKLKVPPSFS
jgi:hypothetical protein